MPEYTPANPAQSPIKRDEREDEVISYRNDSFVFKRRETNKPAYIRVHPNGRPQDWIFETRKFILNSAEEPMSEKYQIVRTFGDTFVHLFGSDPQIFTYSGMLLHARSGPGISRWAQDNTLTGYIDNIRSRWGSDWSGLFEMIYREYLNAHTAAKKNYIVEIGFNDFIRRGTLISFRKTHMAQSLEGVPFSVSMIVSETDMKTDVRLSGKFGREKAEIVRSEDIVVSQQDQSNIPIQRDGDAVVYLEDE